MAFLDPIGKGQRKGMDALAAFGIAALGVCVGLYLVGSHLLFLFTSDVVEARIIEVRHEEVPKGRGSVMAYVPVVQLPNSYRTEKVATYDEQPVYAVGSNLPVRCNASYCTDTSLIYLFIGPLIWLAIGTVMLIVGLNMKNDIGHPEGEILSVLPK